MGGTPRSALRYRPLADTLSPQVHMPRSGMQASQSTTQTGQPGQRVRMTEEGDEFPHHAIPLRRSAQFARRPYHCAEEEPEDRIDRQGDPHVSRSHRRRRVHPLFWLGFGMLLVLGFWQVTTSGAAWWSTHITDPGQDGPTHGNTINAVLGNSDSATSPTKIVALNNQGQVQLIVIPPHNPAKARLIAGPDLVRMHFPDPAQAVLSVQAIDDHGKTNLELTVWADSYVLPFQRYRVTLLLIGDGKGGFEQGQPS